MVKQITTFQWAPHSTGFHAPAPLLEKMLSHSWGSQRNSEIPWGTSQINNTTEMSAHYTPWGGDEEQYCSQASFKAFNCLPPLSITGLNTMTYSSEVLLKQTDAFHRWFGYPCIQPVLCGKGFFNHVDLCKTSLLQADIYQHLPASPQGFFDCFGVGERHLEGT